MILREITLQDVRSYAHLAWQPTPAVNLLVGPNGSGKTNVLEAVALLAGMRLRPLVRDSDLVRRGALGMRIRARVGRDGNETAQPHDIEVALSGRSRRYLRDGSAARPGQDGTPSVVAFTPDDLELVKGGPDARRHLLERDLAQLSMAYRDLLRRYARALMQRNAMLRAVATGERREPDLAPWDEAAATLGAAVQHWRHQAIAAIAPAVRGAYDRMAGAEADLRLTYRPRQALAESAQGDAPDEGRLLAALRAARQAELARGYTLVGPHRDDLGFTLGGNEMRGFASQGEQRTAVVAIKLALLDHLTHEHGDRPLLLLDDVLSELDGTRQDRLLRGAKGYQTLVTTTALPPGLEALVWRTGGGGLTACPAGA